MTENKLYQLIEQQVGKAINEEFFNSNDKSEIDCATGIKNILASQLSIDNIYAEKLANLIMNGPVNHYTNYIYSLTTMEDS